MIVATYNIRLGIQAGVRACADVLARRLPDLVALQEVGRGWTMGPSGDTTAAFAEALGLPHHVHVPAIVREGDARYGTALLCRWPIDVLDVVALPETIDEPRRLLVAGLRVGGEGGPELRVLSTHLSHLDEERPAQGQALAARALAEAARGPTLVMGDLNDPGPMPWLARLRGAFAAADPSSPSPTFPAEAPERRIDWLLASQGAWSDVEVPGGPAVVAASDHLPVRATLDLDLGRGYR